MIERGEPRGVGVPWTQMDLNWYTGPLSAQHTQHFVESNIWAVMHTNIHVRRAECPHDSCNLWGQGRLERQMLPWWQRYRPGETAAAKQNIGLITIYLRLLCLRQHGVMVRLRRYDGSSRHIWYTDIDSLHIGKGCQIKYKPALQKWSFQFAAATRCLSVQFHSSAEHLDPPDDRSCHTPAFPMNTRKPYSGFSISNCCVELLPKLWWTSDKWIINYINYKIGFH